MRILFVPLAGAYGLGAITTSLAIAQEAVVRGHQVAFLAPDDYPLLGQYSLGDRLPIPRPPRPVPDSDGNYRTFTEALYVRGMGDPGWLRSAVRAETDALERFRPDIVYTYWQASVAVSADLAGVPYAAHIGTPDVTNLLGGAPDDSGSGLDSGDGTGPYGAVNENYRDLCAAHGLPRQPTVEHLLYGQAAVNIAPTIPILEPLLAMLPRTCYTGPLLFPPLELAKTPTVSDRAYRVLVYLGIGALTVDGLLAELAQAFPSPGHQVLVAARGTEVCGRPLPFTEGNITVTGVLGMTRALAETDLLVSRGGHSGLMAAMLAGVPVIGVPGDHVEPRFNLAVLEAHGAARILPGHPTAADLAEAAAYLRRTRAAIRASRIGTLLREYTGPVTAVRALEDVVETGRTRVSLPAPSLPGGRQPMTGTTPPLALR